MPQFFDLQTAAFYLAGNVQYHVHTYNVRLFECAAAIFYCAIRGIDMLQFILFTDAGAMNVECYEKQKTKTQEL